MALLLSGVLPERICCITYTKAAASEMRHRVLRQLRELLLMNEAECAARIEELLGRNATAEDIARARSLFGTVLDSPSGGLRLTTIHGFCQDILRRFPLEAGINPHFTVLEEGAADRLIATERNRLLNHYDTGNTVLNGALELIADRTSEARFDQFITAIIGKRNQWERIWRAQTPESLKQKLYALHGLEEGTSEASLRDFLLDAVTESDARTFRAHLQELVEGSNQAGQKLGRALTAWLEVERTYRAGLIDDLCDAFLTQKGEPRASLYGKNQFPPASPLHEACARLSETIQRYTAGIAALASAEETFAVATLAKELLDQYTRAKEEAHALDYDDLIGKVRELFANPSLLGWVMSKLDHRIDHLLLDEAQDTSREQWSITDLLVEELIAANDGVGSGNVPRSLLVVGDEKQSIYSFQGAAPELFAGMKSEFRAKLTDSFSPLATESLSNSYRSAEAVLKLVDHIAAQPEMAGFLSASGAVEPHALKRDKAAGSVTLYAPIAAPEKIEGEPLTLPTEYHISQTAAQQLADKVADEVAGWLKSGRLLESEGRAITAGDILILVRTRSSIVMPLIRALQRRDVPVAGLDRLTLSGHLAVRDLLALMRWSMNPADDLSLAQVLRSPIIGISDEQLCALSAGRSGSLYAQVGDNALLARALNERDCTPYDFLTSVLEIQDTRRVFALRFGEEVHEVLDELKAQAAAMPQGMAPTLANFYDWLSGSERQIKREQEATGDKVRIMTVHGAKGLEAPAVLLVDTVSMPSTQYEKFFFTEDANRQPLPVMAISEEAKRAPVLVSAKQRKADSILAEYYRLLYVALTRARDELHIFGTANKKGEVKEGSWYDVISSAMRELGASEQGENTLLRDIRPAAPAKPKLAPAKHAALPAWARTAAPAISAGPQTASPSRLVNEVSASEYVEASDGSERARGVLIHRILELLASDTDTDTIENLAKLVAPEWSTDERNNITQHIAALLKSENWIWANPSHAEVNVTGTVMMDGLAVPISGQIDRLVETADGMVILDYKTGRHIPETPAGISENYRMQLKTYHALISMLWPGKRVRCAILWTASASLMWCDEEVAATPWKNVAAA